MRALILLDRSFAKRERDMLSRLEIGLADEGVRVVHAVPRAIASDEVTGLYSTKISYDDRSFPSTDRSRVRELADLVSAMRDADDAPVDVVHGFGGAVERLALRLARELGSAAVVEVWQKSSFGRVAEIAARNREVVLCFGDPALWREFRERHPVPPEQVVVAPWGVHVPSEEALPSAPAPERRAPGVVALVEGSQPDAVRVALDGLAATARQHADMLVFADMERSRSAWFWRAARAAGLVDRLSIVPGVEARREPTLRMDAMIVPEAVGKLRSLVLDAMARGVPVVAAADSSIEVLSQPAIANLVRGGDAEAWSAAISRAISRDAAQTTMIARAREFIGRERRASDHIVAVIDAYQRAIARAAELRAISAREDR